MAKIVFHPWNGFNYWWIWPKLYSILERYNAVCMAKIIFHFWMVLNPLLKGLMVLIYVGRLIVVIDVNPSHGFWTARLIKVFGHEGKCTCIYNTHEWIVYIMLFPVVCGTSHGSSWLRRNEFLKMTKWITCRPWK